jgi:hypothetical protein
MRSDLCTPPEIDAMLTSSLVPVLDPASPNAVTIRTILLVVLLILNDICRHRSADRSVAGAFSFHGRSPAQALFRDSSIRST